MIQRASPWLAQLTKTYTNSSITENKSTDVLIIGAGIAGICTAYFTLKNTNLNVIVLESNKIAHGATGHNAGQLVSHFERNISSIALEFGLKMATDAQSSIDSAWDLLDEIYSEAKLKTEYSHFIGYMGCMDLDRILIYLENILVCQKGNIQAEPLLIAKESDIIHKIPQKYKNCYNLAPHTKILSLLETSNKNYVAAFCAKKGCMNSALFCEELVSYMLKKYSKRFNLYEQSNVKEISLEKDSAIVSVENHIVSSKKVVLCTNGYKNFVITEKSGKKINDQFKKSVRSLVGFMAGYLEETDKPPTAIGYHQVRNYLGVDVFHEDPYFYITRRTHITKEKKKSILVCIGGPENKIEKLESYSVAHPYSAEAKSSISHFLKETNIHQSNNRLEYSYLWHGLMGYTHNGIRYIGSEPLNDVLLYNLGCNGVGILPSIYGGKRIASILNGEKMEKSIFDP